MTQTKNLDQTIDAILEKYQIPGAAITLVNKDTVLYSGYFGLSDLERQRAVNPDTKFTIGSISKTFLALGVVKAQESGSLTIQNPLKESSVGNFYTNYYPKSPITLSHLLEHTSGFDEAHFDIFARTDAQTPFQLVLKQSQSALTTRWKPGDYFSYNTLNYLVAAAVLEERVGDSFESFMKRNILDPLEMEDASYHPQENPDWSKGYSSSEEVPFPSLPQWPAGSLTTNLTGLQNLTQLFLTSGTYKGRKVLSPQSIQLMETPETSLLARSGVKFGYGKGLMQEIIGNTVFYGHNGSYGGFLSEFGYSRKQNIGYVILINDRAGAKAIKEIKNVMLDPYTQEVGMDQPELDSELKQWEGAYQPTTFNVELFYPFMRLIDIQVLAQKGTQLSQASMVGGSRDWVAFGNGQFGRLGDPVPSTQFLNEEGRVLWLGETSYYKIPVVGAYFQFYLALTCLVVFIITFFIIGISLLRKLFLKKEIQKVYLFPFLAMLSFVISIVGLGFFYNPEELFSAGAIIYYIGSWLFFALSLTSIYLMIHSFFRRKQVSKLMQFQVVLSSLSCLLISTYLLYWGLVGLMLWSY